MLGSRIAFRWNLEPQRVNEIRRLGSGSYGVVDLVELEDERILPDEMPSHRTTAARKTITFGQDADEPNERLFRHEVEATRRVSGLPLYAAVLHPAGDRGHFYMGYVPGPTLEQLEWHERQASNQLETLRLLIDLMLVIMWAHEEGVAHRDVNPTNVIRSNDDGDPIFRLIDWGQSCHLESSLEDFALIPCRQRIIEEASGISDPATPLPLFYASGLAPYLGAGRHEDEALELFLRRRDLELIGDVLLDYQMPGGEEDDSRVSMILDTVIDMLREGERFPHLTPLDIFRFLSEAQVPQIDDLLIGEFEKLSRLKSTYI